MTGKKQLLVGSGSLVLISFYKQINEIIQMSSKMSFRKEMIKKILKNAKTTASHCSLPRASVTKSLFPQKSADVLHGTTVTSSSSEAL